MFWYGLKNKKLVKSMFYELLICFDYRAGGGEGNRTPVQTYSRKVFYMFIPLLFVGNRQEGDKPTGTLAEWS
jgi:hypothetical protein